MHNPSTDATPNGWLLNPPSNLVEFLANETMVCGLTQRVLQASGMIPGLIALAEAQVAKVSSGDMDAYKRVFEGSQTDAAFAKMEIDNGFSTILSHHAVAMWAAIETALEQLLLNLIRKVSNAHDLILASAPSLNEEKFRTKTANDASKALNIWEGAIKKHSFDRAVEMLRALNVVVKPTELHRQALIELSEVRNVLVHQGGFADERLLRKCPWLKMKPGDEMKITSERMDAYTDAAHAFAVALIGAVVACPYIFKLPASAAGK